MSEEVGSEISKTLKEGNFITIPRQDGRKHSAYIIDINNKTQTVLVEWIEFGETKGKEIEFVNVYALNPEFKNLIDNIKEGNIENNVSTNLTTPLLDNINRQTFIRKDRVSTLKANVEKRNENIKNQVIENNMCSSVTLKNNNARKSILQSSRLSDTNLTKRQPRVSTVVTEIEKLRRNREDRRQRHAEKREEQKTLMRIYPNNPHWKFGKMITDYQLTLTFKPLTGIELVESRQITVCVRKRPINKRELTRNDIDVISIPKKNLILVHEPKSKVDLTKYLDNQQFYFDYVFDDKCNNELVYKYTAKPLIETIFEGGMATCFAYGQTGSGKTHTMGGAFSGKKQNLEKGIYLMAAKDVFDFSNSINYKFKKFIISTTFFEIYQGKVFDLLAKKARLKVLEDGKQKVQVVGLTEKVVTSVESVLNLIELGNAARTSGKTAANSNSSRSHAVFQIILRKYGNKNIYGKFSLIDLAGNERGVDTSSANKTTQIEGAEINKSLLALKECIRALRRKDAHLPFRQSKLTQVLRDSFVGNRSKICMIATISPGMSSCEHTLNTLRYADRVKELIPNTEEEKDSIKELISNGDESDNDQIKNNSIEEFIDISLPLSEISILQQSIN